VFHVKQNHFDVIIVGGGHAGCEAAAAAARRGAKTALISFDTARVGEMSCNPSIGGLGKGHMVKEIDACDGIMGYATDKAALHYRLLNAAKGAAVRGPRVQTDRILYKRAIAEILGSYENLTLIAAEVDSLIIKGDSVAGLVLNECETVHASAIVLATGTFLGGKLFRGKDVATAGRIHESASTKLSWQMRELGLPMGRLKTGTPPRLDGRTIDWASLERQDSDNSAWTMSSRSTNRRKPQLFCAITRTNMNTHDIIRAGLDDSPLFSGRIEGAGPRYCPSIEDKIYRFGDRDGHQIFLEPESLGSCWVYPNGISTSLSVETQEAMIASISGLQSCKILQHGYAVEYDYIDPRSLNNNLELRALKGLFFAGQINGTTGYEEAAAQGLIAGANAAAKALNKENFILDRASSYIGVMVDDLILQGVTEPYRMLTARAEYRLSLRADNADTRLTPIAQGVGLISDERKNSYELKAKQRADIAMLFDDTYSGENLGLAGKRQSLKHWVLKSELNREQAIFIEPALKTYSSDILDEALEDARYAPYIERQAAEIEDMRNSQRISLSHLDYGVIGGLSNEMREKLLQARPNNLGAASRIQGITPAALAAILAYARKTPMSLIK
jgi:tRNA uridine 5-carboxymethylaminomethyl modification enzyme